ncbi:MAG: hypothetical protein WA708_19405 [Acidobacteriaceae bacterium]
MPKVRCIDPLVGDILSGWRYDISGLHSEMRLDYEEHFRECRMCHSRQRLHRAIDMLLIGSATFAVAAFVLALMVLHHIEPLRDWVIFNVQIHQMSLVISLQIVAVLGLLVSLAAWILVAITTPAPTYLSQQARALQARIPEELRDHFPKLSA